VVWIVKTRNIAHRLPRLKNCGVYIIFFFFQRPVCPFYIPDSLQCGFSSASTSRKLLTVKDEAMSNTIITLVTFALVDFLCEGLDVSMFARQAALLYSF